MIPDSKLVTETVLRRFVSLKPATNNSQDVCKMCTQHENMRETKHVYRFIHIAVVTSRDRFPVAHASNCFVTKSRGFSREKRFNEKIVRTAKRV